MIIVKARLVPGFFWPQLARIDQFFSTFPTICLAATPCDSVRPSIETATLSPSTKYSPSPIGSDVQSSSCPADQAAPSPGRLAGWLPGTACCLESLKPVGVLQSPGVRHRFRCFRSHSLASRAGTALRGFGRLLPSRDRRRRRASKVCHPAKRSPGQPAVPPRQTLPIELHRASTRAFAPDLKSLVLRSPPASLATKGPRTETCGGARAG